MKYVFLVLVALFVPNVGVAPVIPVVSIFFLLTTVKMAVFYLSCTKLAKNMVIWPVLHLFASFLANYIFKIHNYNSEKVTVWTHNKITFVWHYLSIFDFPYIHWQIASVIIIYDFYLVGMSFPLITYPALNCSNNPLPHIFS